MGFRNSTDIYDQSIPKSRPVKDLQEVIDARARMHDRLTFHVEVKVRPQIWP